MLSLDLFDSKFEKKLHEGAVDNTIEHLLKPLSLRAAEIRTQLRAGKLDAKQIATLEKEYEELIQKRQDIIFNRKTQTEQQSQPPAKGSLKGKDLVTPQQRVAGATPAKPGVAGAVKDVAGGLKRWLKGEPDSGPTYEAQETQQNPRALGVANFQRLAKANMGNIPTVNFEFIRPEENFKLDQKGLDLISDYYDGLENDQAKNYFIYRVLPSGDETLKVLKQLGWHAQQVQPELPGIPTQGELPLTEKKKSKNDDDLQAGDIKVARELQKLRAQYPAARSDVEAVARAEIDSTERNQRQLAAIRGANEKQDALLKQLVALDQEQGREINSLDSELDRVQSVNDKLQQTLQSMAGTKKVSTAKHSKSSKSIDLIPGAPADAKPAVAPEPEPAPEPAPVAKPAASPAIASMAQQIQGLTKAAPSIRPALDIGKDASNDPQQQTQKRAEESRIKEHGGGIGPKKHWQSMMPEQSDDDDWYDDEDQDLRLRSGDYVRDQQDGEYGEIFRMQGDPEERRVRILDRDGRGWYIEPSRLTRVDPTDPDIQRYFGKRRQRDMDEGYQDFNKVEPYAVCLAGKPVKKFDYYEDARRFHDNWKKKLYREGDKAKADKITLMPLNLDEAANPAQQAAIAIAKKKKQGVAEGKVKELYYDLRNMSEKEFENKYKMSKMRAQRVYGSMLKPAPQQDVPVDKLIDEGIKDAASATAVIACLLTGGSLSGCTTSPQQTSAQQVLRTGQDLGRTMQTAKNITRAGTEAEVQQEIRNILRGINRPEELNNSNILRIWKRIQGPSSVPAEPQAPQYGPAEPVRRAQFEAREIASKDDFLRERDRLLRMMSVESNPANKQILKSAIRQLENRAENEGWLTVQTRMVREDTAALAAEDAILKRIFVKHRDLMMEYGPDKITQAAESVAYNVGDIAHITDEQINEWVGQVESILGARP